MVERYFMTASELMTLASECADEEAANVLKNGALKIFALAQSHGGLIKTAKSKSEPDTE